MNTTILGVRPPERPAFPSHIQWTGDNALLSPPEVEKIVELGDALELTKGTIGNGDANQGVENLDYRCVETAALNNVDWLYKRILERVTWANDAHYRFALSGLGEPVSYLRYTSANTEESEKTEVSTPPGHYDWHQDFGGGPYSNRKLSLVVQLSDPKDYKGCDLVLCTDGPWQVPYKQPGDAIMFPSWTPHSVTNIEEGVRRALVVWISGPQFQ